MNFKYPISKEDSTDYNAEELYGILSREKSGHYLLGNHQFWHGGIHFSTETVDQCTLKQPIRCIADGEVIAYRINKKYKESKLNTTTLQYSNSFCLVKHTYKSPSELVKTPAKDPTKLNDDWQGKKIRILAPTFPSYTDEALSQGKKFMPKSLMLEILQVSSTTKAIGKIEYYPIKAKVLQSVEAKGVKTKEASDAFTKDDEIWFCAFKSDGSIRESKDYKVNLFKDITPQDWTNKTITLAKTYTGYKEIADSTSKTAEKIVVTEKTALQIKEVQTETTNDYHYSKVTASTALKMQDAQDKLLPNKELKAGEEFWIALTDNDGYVPITVDDKELYSDTTPPPEPKTNNLTFYSLYMHLLPYEQYPTQKDEVQKQAKIVKGGLRARDKIFDDKDTKVLGKISKGTIVNILEVKEDEAGNNNCARVTIADNSGKITQINETTKKEEEITPPANGFWIVLKDKQTNNGKITWNEYATEIPQPKREYPSYWTQQVTAKVIMDGMSTRQAPDAGSDVAGATLLVKLNKDDEVTYSNSKVKTLKISGKDYRMAECKLTKEKPEFTEKGITTFWACVESNYMTTTKAAPDTFDTIDTSNAVKISAGDPVGYLGLYEVPASPTGGKSDKPKKQVHIEVFTLAKETELKQFLDNEAGLTGGKQYIKIPKGTVLDKQQAEEAGATANALNSTWQNKETKTLANGFASYSSEALGATGKKRMPKGLKLKILQVKDTTSKIGRTNYYVAKATVLEDIKADLKTTNGYKKDEEIWFAAFTTDKKIIHSSPQNTDLLEDVTPKPTATTKKDMPQTTEQLQEVYYKTQYDHIISPDSVKLVNNKYLVTLYENRQCITGCVAQTKIEKISQYELTKLGFTIIKEQNTNADGSVSTTNTDGFIDQTKMTPFYQDICKEMDSKENGGDGDGKLSLAELRSALKDPVLSEKWSKLIAYHPTEWQAKGDDPKWQRLVSDILPGDANKALREHEKERITNLVFWDDVPDLKGKKEAFHFHPVAFVEHLQTNVTAQIIFPLKVKPKNDKEGVWKNYYWAAGLKDSNASQAIFGRNRSGGVRKHAARDLYTEPLTEIVAICDGEVKSISTYYYGTWQITIKHETNDGRKFFIRYGEVDPKSIVVKVGDKVKQGNTIAKTGLMINPKTNQHPSIISGQTVYMIHFEYYTGSGGLETPPPNNTGGTVPPYDRRKDIHDPLDILQEGYKNTFENGAKIAESNDSRVDVNQLNVSDEGKAFIKEWEGFYADAYNDSEGYCTIGYGHLIEKKKCEDITLPEEFKNGITKQKANELFESRITNYVTGLKNSVIVKLHQYEFDALVSLLFNIGASGLDKKAPSLKKKLNNSDYKGAATEFLDITNGGTSGLVKRRKSENNLFLNNIYDSSH